MKFNFLICSERSGSNLITRIMDAHSEVCGPYPAHLFRYLNEHRLSYGDFHLDENWQQFISDAHALFSAKLGAWRTDWAVDQFVHSRQRNAGALLSQIYSAEARAAGKEILFIKENQLYHFLPMIMNAFPTSKFIYMVRDPRDMALSWKNSPALRGCVIRAAETWRADQQASLRVLSSLQDSGRILQMRYETLLDQPETLLAAICNFLDIAMERPALAFHRSPLTIENSKQAADWQNLGKPLIRANHGKYKAGLIESEIRYVEQICAKEMSLLGYLREYQTERPLKELKTELLAYEQHEKPAYLSLSEEERSKRREFVRITSRMQQRITTPFKREASHCLHE